MRLSSHTFPLTSLLQPWRRCQQGIGGECHDDIAQVEASDPLAELMRSVDDTAADVGDAGAKESHTEAPVQSAVDDATELPPGVFMPRLPAGWVQYIDPATSHPYYVNEQGECTWARPSG